MIKYNTRDLIRRATQLADLENSDFISWNENIMAINEAYQAIYQKAIDRDEKFYLKECVITNPVTYGNRTCYDLPSDFYQLYAVNEVNGNRCIIRATVNDSFALSSYDIINNQLVINGAYSGSILFRYFPTPKALTYKGNDVSISLPNDLFEKANIIDIYDRNIAYVTTDISEDVHIFNWETNEDFILGKISETSQTFRDENVIGCKNGVAITYVGQDGLKHGLFYNYNRINQVGLSLGDIFGLDSDKNMVKLEISKDVHNTAYSAKLVLPYSDKLNIPLKENVFKLAVDLEAKIPLSEHEQSSIYMNLIDNNILKFTDFNAYIEDISKPETVIYTITNYECDISKDSVKITNKTILNYDEAIRHPEIIDSLDVIYGFYNNGTYYFKDRSQANDYVSINGEESFSNAIGVMKIDEDTGYGIMVKNGTNAIIKSICSNTELDYPNNLFINLLAYKLALSYKAKQGGDTNSLMVQYQQAEDLFYDTIARDIYSPVRIQNVY